MSLKSIDTKNYEEAVVMSVKPVIISMWSKAMPFSEKNDKILEQIENEYGDYVKIMKLNMETQPRLMEMFEIDRLPVIVMMTGGVVCKKLFGLPTKQEIIDEMEIETIKEFRDRGITYHPKRNYIPDYIRNERW